MRAERSSLLSFKTEIAIVQTKLRALEELERNLSTETQLNELSTRTISTSITIFKTGPRPTLLSDATTVTHYEFLT